MNFFSQLRLLLWKMWINKKRRPLGTLCEIFLPVLLTSILIFVRDEVEIENQPVTYGISVPVFSIFDVDGLPVSLPGTLDAQDICLNDSGIVKINKFIAVTPDDQNTRWFLGELENYYNYISDQSLLSYYNWNYWSEDVDNFRDLFILLNDTLDWCVNLQNSSCCCSSFIEVLDIFGFDIYDDDQLEVLIAIINVTIVNPDALLDFFDFINDLELLDLSNLTTIEFNVTDPDEIAELLEFVKYIYSYIFFYSKICYFGLFNQKVNLIMEICINLYNRNMYKKIFCFCFGDIYTD